MKELEDLDAPLPLPDSLRARLEAQLLAPVPLEDAQRSALEARLVRRPRRWLVPTAAAAAAAGVLGGVLLLDSPATPPTGVALRPTPAPTTSVEPPVRGPAAGGLTGTGSTGGGSTGGGTFQGRKSLGDAAATPTPAVPAAMPAPLPPPPPDVDEVVPATAYAGAEVGLRGTGLADPVEVRFGSAVAEVLSSSDDVVRVRVPAGSGTVDVVVETTSGTSSPVLFTYRA